MLQLFERFPEIHQTFPKHYIQRRSAVGLVYFLNCRDERKHLYLFNYVIDTPLASLSKASKRGESFELTTNAKSLKECKKKQPIRGFLRSLRVFFFFFFFFSFLVNFRIQLSTSLFDFVLLVVVYSLPEESKAGQHDFNLDFKTKKSERERKIQ